MATRAKKVLAGIAALAALAFGGAAIAQAGGDSQAQHGLAPATSESAQQSEAPEGAEGAEANDAAEQEGSEVPGDDGPGGHADEPANPNADHQFQGKE